jgi:N-carbamoyl-L-amino-acid hydrolase
MAGSHLDTVPEGGAFDGVLGACAALECIRTMRDAGIEPKTAAVVVATAEEEGRFGGMLGSQAMVGAVTPEWLRTASDSNDVALMEAMRAKGLDAPSALEAAWRPGSIEAFIELHIEQGPVLERAGAPLGIVSGISGVCNLQVRFTGIANHSGTTPMEMRADAFAGLASVAGAIPDIIHACGTGQSRITIGKVEIQPNTAHTIPGIAEFSIIIRDTSDAVMRKLRAAVDDCIEKAAKAHGLAFEIEERSWLAPVSLDDELSAILFEEAARLGVTAMGLPSGAGHDAQTMQSFCPSGLIFVPSRNGISHSPSEWSDWGDMERGAQLMLNALLRLSAG